MSSPSNIQHSLRRSSRVCRPTLKKEHFIESVSEASSRFPSDGDEIFVKWILDGEHVWWPASVLQVEDHIEQAPSRIGCLQYHWFGKYQPERASVRFSFNSSDGERLVASFTKGEEHDHKQDGQQHESSWVFRSEHEISTSEGLNSIATNRTRAGTFPENGRYQRVGVIRLSSAISKETIRSNKVRAALNNQSLPITSQDRDTCTRTCIPLKNESVPVTSPAQGNSTGLNPQSIVSLAKSARSPLASETIKQDAAHRDNTNSEMCASSSRIEIIETRLSLL